MERRKKLIESLLKQKVNQDWQGCLEIVFRILYGLPASIQLSLSKFAIKQYLPIFQRKWPYINWPAILLSDLDGWLGRYGRTVPVDPYNSNPADNVFFFSFDALMLAASYPDDQLILTSSCIVCISSAISALQCNVWIADDPEGFEMWRQQGYFPGHSVGENRPAIAIAEREWEKIASWLTNEEVWRQPSEFTTGEIENALARWKQHEMLLIHPGESDSLGE